MNIFDNYIDNIFHTEEIYETFENDGNSTKRIKIGQIKDNIDGQNVTTQLIHEADDNHGNKLSPEVKIFLTKKDLLIYLKR